MRVVQFAAPTHDEKRHHFLWRFWPSLPGWGGMAVFDRSWYGRVLVERVEGFATREQWLRAYDEINGFERTPRRRGDDPDQVLAAHLGEEQLKRFKSREKDPLKSWKLTDEDWRNREKRDEYKQAVEDMVARTSIEPHAPWHLVPAESKRYARVAVIDTVISEIEEGMRRHGIEPPAPLDWGRSQHLTGFLRLHPARPWHTWQCVGERPGRILITFAPAGLSPAAGVASRVPGAASGGRL